MKNFYKSLLGWKNILALVLIFGLAGYFYKISNDWLSQVERNYTTDRFNDSAKTHVSLIEDYILGFIDDIEQLASFISLHPEVSKIEFEHFASSLIGSKKGFQALEFVEIVDKSEKTDVIQRYTEFYPDFTFKRLIDGVVQVDNFERDIYYPIVFAFPYQENRQVIGYDPYHLDVRMDALLKSKHSKTTTLSSQIDIVQRPNETAFLIFSPVFKLNQDKVLLISGFAEGVFALKEVVTQSTKNLADKNLQITISDQVNNQKVLLENFSLNGLQSMGESTDALIYERLVNIAGQNWKITITGKPEHFKTPLFSIRPAALLLFLLLSTILLYLFYLVYSLYQSNKKLVQNKNLLNENLEQLEKSREEIIYQSSHDSLTGLKNRQALDRKLQKIFEKGNHQKSKSIALIDLDNFKVVNEAFGIDAGNYVIKQLAHFIQDRLSKSGAVYRVGVDEFLLIFSEQNIDKNIHFTKKLLKDIRDLKHPWKGYSIPVSASAGITQMSLANSSISELFSQLTTATYVAKERGGNRLYQYNANDQESGFFQDKLNWINILRDSLDNEKFVLRVQTIKSLKDNSHQLEVLLSLKNDDGTINPSMDFIAAAEKLHMMSQIDLWVVNKVFEQIIKNKSDKHWCINLSGSSLNDDLFRDELTNLIAKTKIDLSKITFEITETSAISNFLLVKAFINTSKHYGCKFSLDDFGSGMSSYTYLRELPVDYIKVDGTFITRMLDSELDYTIAKGICDLSKQLEIQTIAEFVETEAIYHKVVEMDFDYAQGYFIDKPTILE